MDSRIFKLNCGTSLKCFKTLLKSIPETNQYPVSVKQCGKSSLHRETMTCQEFVPTGTVSCDVMITSQALKSLIMSLLEVFTCLCLLKFVCFRCLQYIIEGLGHNFNPYVDQDLLDLIFRALTHTNRFVRETGYYVCSSLVACGCVQDGNIINVYFLCCSL